MSPSDRMPWFKGPELLPFLETVKIGSNRVNRPLRFPIQWVNRPDQDFRGLTGTVAAGRIICGETITVLPSGQSSVVQRIVTMDGDLESAKVGQAVTLLLADEIDAGRGDMIVARDRPSVADRFVAHILWMSDQPLLSGRAYLLQIGPLSVGARVATTRHMINVETFACHPVRHVGLNELALCEVLLDRDVPFDAYADNHDTGGFILIDRIDNRTVGCGMIASASCDAHQQMLSIDKAARAALKGQKPCVLWFTGLSAATKSTIANAVERKLLAAGFQSYLLDGDNVRFGLSRDLDFSLEDRIENVRRVSEMVRMFVDAGLIVIVSMISPFREERNACRRLLDDGEFFEIWVNTPLDVCERRDPKDLYRRARAGLIADFTGIDSPYEPPENPELLLDTSDEDADQLADRVLAELRTRKII